MRSLLLLTFLVSAGARAELVAWFPLQGSTNNVINNTKGQLVGDALFSTSQQGCQFGGHNGAVVYQDLTEYGFDESFSIYAEVYPFALPNGGTSPAGQIVFRGDDRNGLYNYSLNLGEDGYLTFYFNSPDNQGAGVRTKARMNQWQRILATFDAKSHTLRIYVDDFLMGQNSQPITPVTRMENEFAPRFAIGNVQNPLGGAHNQPFHGTIRNVKLFNTAIFPDDASRTPRNKK